MTETGKTVSVSRASARHANCSLQLWALALSVLTYFIDQAAPQTAQRIGDCPVSSVVLPVLSGGISCLALFFFFSFTWLLGRRARACADLFVFDACAFSGGALRLYCRPASNASPLLIASECD